MEDIRKHDIDCECGCHEEKPVNKRKDVMKVGRNDPCHCGSGKKFKKCCIGKIEKKQPRTLVESILNKAKKNNIS